MFVISVSGTDFEQRLVSFKLLRGKFFFFFFAFHSQWFASWSFKKLGVEGAKRR